MSDDTGYERLESQIRWYYTRSIAAQRNFRMLKTVQIVVAALIPVASLLQPDTAIVPGVLGALILILEGVQELGMYRQNWQKYRSSCEALRQGKYLFLADAGPFRDVEDDEKRRMLAERVEELLGHEHANWVSQFQETKKKWWSAP